MDLFFHCRLPSSKIWSTLFFGFIGILKNWKLRNNFVVYIILENLERLGNVSIVQGVLAFVAKRKIQARYFLKIVLKLWFLLATSLNQKVSNIWQRENMKPYAPSSGTAFLRKQFAIFVSASRCQYPKVKKLPSRQIELERGWNREYFGCLTLKVGFVKCFVTTRKEAIFWGEREEGN